MYRNINFPEIAPAACNSLIVETFEAFEAFEAFEVGGRRPWFWFRATLLAPAVRHGCTSTAAVLLYRVPCPTSLAVWSRCLAESGESGSHIGLKGRYCVPMCYPVPIGTALCAAKW